MRFDVVALGRIAVDLYGEQKGTSLIETATFRRYVGGSSGNLAIGCARQGLRTAMLSCVGDDPMGRYIRSVLEKEQVSHAGVSSDPVRRTALAFLGMQRADAIALDFYRESPADMGVTFGATAAEIVKSSRLLSTTGTHATDPSTAAVLAEAVACATQAGCRTVLDIDFRKALWEQAPGGVEGTAAGLRRLAADMDLVVGNEEEFVILGGSADVSEALKAVRAVSRATLVLKLGAAGSIAFEGAIPPQADWQPVPGFAVEVVNVVGAGDAFLAGALARWLEGAPLDECLRHGNLCGALVVSRHACSDAMPYAKELAFIEERAATDLAPILDDIERLHTVLKRPRVERGLAALAFDHRIPFIDMMKGSGRRKEDVVAFKKLIAQAARETASRYGFGTPGVLIDPLFGAEVMDALTEKGWWIGRPVERTGSRPLRFEAEDCLEATIAAWHPRHVAKCLVWYHPHDDDALKREQQASLRRLQSSCRGREQEWMLEVILPFDMERSDDLLIEAVQELYGCGLKPDWLKLSPLQSAQAWERLDAVIRAGDPYCCGVILLGLNQPVEALAAPFRLAADQPVCQGFAVGRSIFMEPARKWFAGTIDDRQAVDEIKANYSRVFEMWAVPAVAKAPATGAAQ